MIKNLTTSLLLFLLDGVTSKKDGISFVVIGDYGYMKNLKYPNGVFDEINKMKESAVKDSTEDFDFFTTVGDNIYPNKAEHPTDNEFKKMIDLFLTRSAIKDLPIYPVRGNHDCYFED